MVSGYRLTGQRDVDGAACWPAVGRPLTVPRRRPVHLVTLHRQLVPATAVTEQPRVAYERVHVDTGRRLQCVHVHRLAVVVDPNDVGTARCAIDETDERVDDGAAGALARGHGHLARGWVHLARRWGHGARRGGVRHAASPALHSPLHRDNSHRWR